jgi:hypothetical protein
LDICAEKVWRKSGSAEGGIGSPP